MSTDPWQDPTIKRWVQHVLDEMVPKLRNSAAVAQIVPGPDEVDVKFCVELGATIMLEKPIIVVVFGERRLPAKLAAIADEVVRLPEGVNPEGADELAAALNRVLGLDD
jgi:hypothetical protein